MPPPLPAESDAESVAEEQSTPKPTSASAQAKEELKDAVMEDVKAVDDSKDAADEDDEDSSDDEGDGEVYVVEQILDHRSDFPDNQMRYWIKWKGYEKKSDRTWEAEENLEGARELLEAYWESIGGKPVVGEPKAKKGRKSLTGKRSNAALNEKEEKSESPAPKKQKRGRKSNAAKAEEADEEEIVEFRGYVEQGADDWKPPQPKSGAWDPLLQKVDTIEQDDSGDRWVYICWNDKNADGRFYRSKAKLATVYKAAPQKMLIFYEQHLVFTEAGSRTNKEPAQNGGEVAAAE